MPSQRKLRLSTVITAMTFGGAQRILVDYLTRLPKWIETEVLTLYPGPMSEMLRNEGIPVYESNLHGVGSLRAIPRWTKHFKDSKPDIVHTHLGKADLCGRLAARRAGVPVVLTTSHNSEHWKKNPALNAIDNWSLRQADGILAVSNEVKRFLVERGQPAAKIQVSYARAELRDRFREAEVSADVRRRLREELEVAEGALVSIMVGRMHPQKAHEVAFQAMAKLPATDAQHVLVLAGEGPLRPQHEAEARRLGIDGNVRFLGNRADVENLLRFADVFVMPSRWEGAPLALMEAHGAGLPAVVSDIESMSEVVNDCAGALVGKVDDPDSIAGKWAELLADGELRKKLGTRARERALENWDIRGLRDEWLDYYRNLARGSQSLKKEDLPTEFLGEVPNGAL